MGKYETLSFHAPQPVFSAHCFRIDDVPITTMKLKGGISVNAIVFCGTPILSNCIRGLIHKVFLKFRCSGKVSDSRSWMAKRNIIQPILAPSRFLTRLILLFILRFCQLIGYSSAFLNAPAILESVHARSRTTFGGPPYAKKSNGSLLSYYAGRFTFFLTYRPREAR